MNKPIVLAFHGMGTHKTGDITDETKQGLSNSAALLEIESFDPDNEFEFREFNYSQYLDEKRKEWADEASAISEVIGAGPDLVKKINELHGKLGDADFLYTHWLDVITYCLFGTLRETVLSRSIELILSTLKEAKDDPENIRPVILLGHSLGTAVLHDSITKLYLKVDEPDDDKKIRFANYPVDGLWTIANVSRMTHLITRLEDPNHSIARDHSQGAEGMSYAFYPVYNQYDPITVFKRFALDPQWGDLIRTNEIREIKSDSLPVNPHSLVEYLSDPEVGGTFLSEHSTLTITEEQLQIAKDNYRKTTIIGPISDTYERLKNKILKLEPKITELAELRDVVSITIELYELINDAYQLLKNNKGKE